jgi:predicted nucleic acid-binding Zn ribbon protein
MDSDTESDVKTASAVLQQVLRAHGLEERVRGFQAAESWPEIVGPALAGRSSVMDFREGRLTVEAAGASVMLELRMRQDEILRQFASRYGPALVREIRFVPGGGREAGARHS